MHKMAGRVSLATGDIAEMHVYLQRAHALAVHPWHVAPGDFHVCHGAETLIL